MKNTKANKKEVVAIMPITVINAAVDTLASTIKGATITIGKAYATMRGAIVQGIPNSLGANTSGYNEYQRRLDIAAARIFKSGISSAKSEKTVKDNLRDGLKADGFIAPTKALTKSETEQKALDRDATRKAKARAVAKVKSELKKVNPTRKFKIGELEELAAAHIAEAKEVSKEENKQQKAVAAKLEGVTGFNTLTFPQECREGKYSNGTMPRTQAAFAAFLMVFREETQE